MSNRKMIYLVRHAKSSWNSGASSDFERPLSDRGQDDALRIGKALKARGWKPERIIASPAIRAKQTCQLLCEPLGYSWQNVIWNRDIYAAYMISLLHILNTQPESAQSVMLIGHNPAMEDLLVHFCGNLVLQAQRQKNGKLLTTGNVARLVVESQWKDFTMAEAKLDALLRPREL